MKKIIILYLMLLMLPLSSCNDHSSPQNNRPIADSQVSNIIETAKKTIVSAKEIGIDFNIEAAKGTEGYLSLCTDYQLDTNSRYDINYDSCALSESLENGHLNSSIELSRGVHSIIGVVLFDDISIEPIYKEFNLSHYKNLALHSNRESHILSWN